jgi:hypothetical protein
MQLGVLECKVYHNVLLNTESQIHFNRLIQLQTLDKTEKVKDISWECYNVVNYYKKRR